MRILFFGDYSNLHACLAKELRRRGHEVSVISDGGGYMQTARDITLKRDAGIAGSLKYLSSVFSLIQRLKDYDVVQLINPNFLSLRPGKIKYFFDILKGNNRGVFLTLAGDDYFFTKACLEGRMFRFSEFCVGDRKTEFENQSHRGEKWIGNELRILNEHIYNNVDGAMSVLPEYDMAARPILGDKLVFTNIPVDLENLKWRLPDISGKIRIFIGMRGGMEIQKGTAILLDVALELQRELPEMCEVVVARNLELNEYLRRMSISNIVLDQLYSYSPGTNGFQAMALGPVAGTGAQPEFYEYIGESCRPIIALSPLTDTEQTLRELILNPERMEIMSREARELVERHNDVAIVADKFEKHWNSILC